MGPGFRRDDPWRGLVEIDYGFIAPCALVFTA
jgi:hypothetical protein